MSDRQGRYFLTGWYVAGGVRVDVEHRADTLKTLRTRADRITDVTHIPPIDDYDLTLYDQEGGEKVPLE